jgi:hypothetical protein
MMRRSFSSGAQYRVARCPRWRPTLTARVARPPTDWLCSSKEVTPIATSYILGLSAFYHDSAACLLRDGLRSLGWSIDGSHVKSIERKRHFENVQFAARAAAIHAQDYQ